LEPGLLHELKLQNDADLESSREDVIDQILEFGTAVGKLLVAIRETRNRGSRDTHGPLQRVWAELKNVSNVTGVPLKEAALANVLKRASRWPIKPGPLPIFDDDYPEEEQLPRRLEVGFLERKREGSPVVILRIKGVNVGDRLTDNIEAPDEYRYHDVFHFGHAALLGWSPVTRSLLRCKRKSRPSVDENEDGGRAQVVEEAISAMVFSRAKELRFFQDVNHLDYDLLKTIQSLIRGYEVERVPLWQWEKTILRSYAVFRKLRANRGGRVLMDLRRRTLEYRALDV
jgi:hypothetical protein